MRLPLIVLAALALVAGFGLAGIVFGEDYGKFFEVHFGAPALVSLVTLAIGVFGAFKLYWGRDTEPLNLRLFANKFYFDEIYAKIVGICQDAVASIMRVLDSLFIDGLGVGGAKSIASNAGQALRRVQSGNIQGYTFLFGLGVLVIVFLALAK
jgi:NADH-quinone oxidoreductase subunit L